MPTKKKTQPSRQVEDNVKREKKEEKIVPTKVEATSKRDVVVPILVAAIIVASFAVGYLYGKVSVYEKIGGVDQQPTTAANPTATAKPQVSLEQVKSLFDAKKNIVFGDPKSKVLFVEFGDPSCPYCHIASGDNPELNKEVGDRFVLVEDGGTYRAPVKEMRKLVNEGKAAYAWFYSPGHGNGELATQALYCAKEQNKFWEVHDLLMSNKGYDVVNNTVKNETAKIPQLVDFVKSVADANKLKACLESGKYAGRIQEDTALGRKLGVQGTPSFFVNETNFPGAYNYTDMEPVVQEALK